MNSPWKQLHPQDRFSVKLAQPITSYDEQVLSFLYQPIIGIDAFSLYHMFLTSIDPNEFDSHQLSHSDLFNQLNIDLPRLFQARIRLEGIGLLKVYVKEEREQRVFLYELQRPLTAGELFRDDVLSLLLLDCVGERRYQVLLQRFAIPAIPKEEYQEVTKKFMDVYQFSQERFRSHNDTLTKTKGLFPKNEPDVLSSVSDSFDWLYFVSLLDGLYIDKEQVEKELKETVYTLHQLYGINELEMKQLIEPEVDFVTNQVQLNQLRQKVVLQYQVAKRQEKSEPDLTNELTEDEQLLKRRNTLNLQGFTTGEVEVIMSSESISPMIFLSAIKNQKGGFVANEERWAIENLVKQSGLPDSVINVLIHFILVGKGNASLNPKFANSIANDWAQAQVFSPEAAMTKVKELGAAQQAKAANYAKKPTYQKRNTQSNRKETLPDWVDSTKTETPVSIEEEAFFKEQLRLLRANGKEGDN